MTILAVETELKLWLHPGDIEAFRSLPRLGRARAHREKLRSIYFDTPDALLAGRGVALRVRKTGRRWLQTLKAEGERGGGLSKRLELETAISGPAPDFSRLPAAVADGLIPANLRAALAPVYETRFQRTAWNLRAPDRSRVEVALDAGEILAGGKSEALCEVELELKSGSTEALYALAQTFASQVLLIPLDASKAERGTRLAAGKPRAPASAEPPRLDKDMPSRAAFARIARACLTQLQANLPGLLTEQDPEYLHQARVALRRLRSAAGLFKKLCPPPAPEMARLAELSRVLGEARDWDVFVLETLPGLMQSVPAAQKTLLARRAGAARGKARAAAQEAVRRPRTAADMLAMHHWLNGLETMQGKPALHGFARKRLAVLHRRALAEAAGFAEQSPARRHALRIRVKRLRYALNYLGGLFGGHEKFAACFAALQDELGELNDAATALRFLGRLNGDGRMNGLVAQLGRDLDVRMQNRIDATGKTLQRFSGLRPPWL